MIISEGRRYIFVHIPKTGGTSLAQALEARAMADDILIGDTPKAKRRRRRLRELRPSGRLWKHSRLSDIRGVVSERQMEEFFILTLVRNPWDRLASYYHWLREQSFDHPAVKLAHALPFSDFLRHEETLHSIGPAHYASYVTLPGGRERCDLFARIEHFDKDIAPFEAHLGFSLAPLPRINTSSRQRDYRQYYSEEDAEYVARLCARDVARFGYTF